MDIFKLYTMNFNIQDAWSYILTFVVTHFVTLATILVGFLIVSHLLKEKKSPSYTFAWVLLILFIPFVGIPMYFFLGGRKSNRVLKNKKAVQALAAEISGAHSPKDISESEWQNNTLELLPDDITAYNKLCEEINNATENICIITYVLGSDKTAKTIIQLLCKKAKAGVEVKLLVDALGSFGHVWHITRPLVEAGGAVARFMPVIPLQTKTSANLRNHRKIAIFDYKRAIVGGQNLDTRFLGPTPDPKRFKDFSVTIEGPAVESLRRIFVSDWCFTSGESPRKYEKILAKHSENTGDQVLKVIASGPDCVGDPLWEQLITLVQECQEELTIVTPYFVPDEVLFRSLMVKAYAGKKINLIVPEKSNQFWVDFARNYYLRQLDESGVNILLYEPGMLHAKLFLVDGHTGMIGSANMDIRSFFVNFEIGIMLESQQSIDTMRDWTDEVIKSCKSYKDSKYAYPKCKRRLVEDISHLLIPLL